MIANLGVVLGAVIQVQAAQPFPEGMALRYTEQPAMAACMKRAEKEQPGELSKAEYTTRYRNCVSEVVSKRAELESH